MEASKINFKFRKADRCLEAAKNELNRPSEDVVPFMVYRNARLSISNDLPGFLWEHGKQLFEDTSAESLPEECCTVNPRFKELELNPLRFMGDEGYSAAIEQVEGCHDLATFVRQIVGGKSRDN